MSNSDGTETPGPTHESVISRAEGRPPEEEWSDDPEHQAEVLLEESEERTLARANLATEGEGDVPHDV